MTGIYQITCLPTGKRYIGSSVNIAGRWTDHKRALLLRKHINPKLQAAWDKYGQGNFRLEVLEEAEATQLMIAEQRWLDKTKPELNINPNADAPMRGKSWNPDQRAAISARNKGDRRMAYWTGSKNSEETKAKRNAALLKACATPEARARLRLARAIQLGVIK
jgi:group I intron endonuclease